MPDNCIIILFKFHQDRFDRQVNLGLNPEIVQGRRTHLRSSDQRAWRNTPSHDMMKAVITIITTKKSCGKSTGLFIFSQIMYSLRMLRIHKTKACRRYRKNRLHPPPESAEKGRADR